MSAGQSALSFANGYEISVNVPDFIGPGAVSVKVSTAEDFSPMRSRFLPEAEIQVVPPESLIVPALSPRRFVRRGRFPRRLHRRVR
jgi:hypothetical protein